VYGVDALRTDLYQLTMAAGYFHRGMTGALATCELFVRRLPERRRYLVAMGIDRALDYLEALRLEPEDLDYLRTVPALRDAMTPELETFLRELRFTGDVWGVPEGTVVFANEPLLRVTAPIVEAQLVETFLLSAVNHATMIASKAARMLLAAGNAQLMEFGTRRTHPEAAVDAARTACAVGFVGTSNVEAGRRFGVPVLGTAAHMWTMAHDSEEAAFHAYVDVFPRASILLIDTYDTVRGAERAVRVAGDKLKGVRLDSGDLDALSRAVREVLDAAGLRSTKIVASGDLNEYKIAELVRAGAPIDLYGIGTELVASVDAPSLAGVYKLVEITRDGTTTPIAKFSAGKATWPGAHQIWRYRDESGRLSRDVVTLDTELAEGARDESGRVQPLLQPLMARGKRLGSAESLDTVRERVREQLASLPEPLRSLDDGPERYPVTPSQRLSALVAELAARFTGG
jgi:nicotinate phosphoribosyltransferase